MKLTKGANLIIDKLTQGGYKAYAVGGAVRDSVMAVPFSDVDVTTSATPTQMLEVFKDLKVYPTGLKHGTITVVVDDESIEVTTFRTEKGYSDNRRPDEVTFINDLEEDLKRRDFTINAMAYNDKEGLIDYFDGVKDVKNKIIRAVGDADTRFKEDALRILRALRFSSVLNFEIEKSTKDAIFKNKKLLKNVSIERVYVELIKLLLGDGVERVLLEYREVIFEIIPELKASSGFDQKSTYHCYDVYTHIVKSLAVSKKDKIVRLSLLLHDIGKPLCFTIDDKGVGHFYGHQLKSAEMANSILKRLKVDNYTLNTVTKIIELHDTKTNLSRYEVKNFLRLYGIEFLELLTSVRLGDTYAHSKDCIEDRKNSIINMLEVAKDIIKNNECYLLKDLKINGNDVKSLGFSGEDIKNVLNNILFKVMKGELKNERQILLKAIKND